MSVIEMEAIQDNLSGKLIALEGDTDVIATQLRLLPPSQKILILPNFSETSVPEVEKEAFDARAFIRELQKAVIQRTETARSFLQTSTPTQPRLVFTVHGSVSARTTCITKISQNITNGNIEEAEAVFNHLVKDGIAGLAKADKVVEQDQDIEEQAAEDEDQAVGKHVRAAQEVSERAFSDANDAQEQHSLSLTDADSALERVPSRGIPPKSRVMDLVRGMEKPSKEEGLSEPRATKIPISKFASPTSHPSDKIVRTVLTVPDRKTSVVEKRTTFGHNQGAMRLDQLAGGLSHQSLDDTDTDTDTYTDDEFSDLIIASPGGESILSVPQTPGGVEYGEACLVDVQSGSPTKSVKRAHSVDKLFPSNDRVQNYSSIPRPLKQSKSHYQLRREPPTTAVQDEDGQDSQRFPTLPRTTFVKASETTIKRSPTSSRSSRSLRSTNSSSSSTETPDCAVFVERGTDAIEIPIDDPTEVPFAPVFELVEDLVIHFTDDQPNDIFESVLRSYKSGTYPIIPAPLTPASSETPSSPSSLINHQGSEVSLSPRSISSLQLEVDPEVRPTSYLTNEADDYSYNRRSFDPYSDDSYPPDIKRPSRGNLGIVENPFSTVAPPKAPMTVEMDIPITMEAEENPLENRFVEFSPANTGNAISVQNSFRELLSIIFPASENYSQYVYPVATEAERLWKPVFRNEEGGPIGIEGRTVDQIIAFGCEEGVKKDFFYQISGQIEKIGTKRDGSSRSGKLDIRYVCACSRHDHHLTLSGS